jgi:PAS domain S-box-containing protein
MELQPEHSTGEIKRLERCINDLVSLLALPAIWSGGDPSQVLDALLDALMGMLSLDLVSVRLTNSASEAAVEIVRVAQSRGPIPPTHQICEALRHSLGDNSRKWPPQLRSLMGEGDVSIVPLPLGLQGELGIVIAAAQRADFPQPIEALLLSVAASQASIGMQEVRLRDQQKRIANQLDQQVAQRTAELAAANAELKRELTERKLMEERLRQEESELKRAEVRKATILDSALDCIVTIDHEGRIREFNSAAERTFGFGRDEVLGRYMADVIIPPSLREKHRQGFARYLATGDARILGRRIELTAVRADGSEFPVELAVTRTPLDGPPSFTGYLRDITERKRAEQALLASERNLRRVIDTIPTLAWCNLPNGPNEFLSKSWHQYTGLSPEEAHGWGWSTAFHPDDLPPLMKRWQELLVSGESGEIEARLRRHDGQYRWFLIRVAPFRNHTGAIERWYGTSTDIDDRKRVEEALRASESQLRQVVDSIPGLVCTMSLAGEIATLNKQLLEYFGKTPEDLKNWRMTDAVHPDDLPRVVTAFDLAIRTGAPYEVEHRCRRADGVYRWFQVRALTVQDKDGQNAGRYVLLTDIDERKHAEEKLRHSEALLAESQRLSKTGSFMWRVATNEITWSEQLYDIFEFDEGTPLTFEKVYSRVHPDDIQPLQEAVEGARRDGSNIDREHRLLMPNHSVKYLNIVAHAARDKDGLLEYIGAVQDVTRRRMSEEAVNKARSDLAHMSRVTSLGAMTASIAHEVRQPLSGIITNASTCLRMLATDPPNVDGARETAQRTIRDGNRMSEVITRLRALFSKKEPTAESVNLNEAVLEVIALSIVELQKNRVMLRPELADNLPLVTGDRVQLQQVILNLLRNGSDAMSTVEDRPRLLVIRTERGEGDRVRLTVQDAGVGFDPQAVDQLFDPFFTTKGDGMGIGLSVSRSIIESHHGRMWATLNDGPGAAFSFSIPRAPEGLARADGIRNSQPPAVTGTA